MDVVSELKQAARNIKTILDHLENLADIAQAIDRIAEYLDLSVNIPAPPRPELTLYSQRDPRWRHLCYHGSWTFGSYGCYTVAGAMIASLAGYTDDPPTFARKIAQVGAYEGGELLWPYKIPQVYPLLEYAGRLDWVTKSLTQSDMEEFAAELDKGPCIVQVDFYPGGALQTHFVVAEGLTPDRKDLLIADPWDGTCTRLLERYAREHWDLSRALYGARLLRPAQVQLQGERG